MDLRDPKPQEEPAEDADGSFFDEFTTESLFKGHAGEYRHNYNPVHHSKHAEPGANWYRTTKS